MLTAHLGSLLVTFVARALTCTSGNRLEDTVKLRSNAMRKTGLASRAQVTSAPSFVVGLAPTVGCRGHRRRSGAERRKLPVCELERVESSSRRTHGRESRISRAIQT